MEEMHFTTPFFLMEGRNQRLQRRACGVNVVAIQCVSYPFDLVAKLDGASTPPHDTSAIRSFAATASSAQTDGHNLRSDRVSNANVRVLMDDSAQGATPALLELHGIATEPVRDVRDVMISLYPREKLEVGTARLAAVGAIIQARPHLEFELTWSHADFDRVWIIALGGRLTHGHFYFTKPHYNRELVVSLSFSTELEE